MDKEDRQGLAEIDLEDLDDPLKYVSWNEDGKDGYVEDSVRHYVNSIALKKNAL